MQIRLTEAFAATAEGAEAEAILRACVHCGFCAAACPTYRLLGDERDGPRGRIYLMKQLMEGETSTAKTQTHLDRCLACRACETACPSGVRYGRLLDIGRGLLEENAPRPFLERLQRRVLLDVLPYPGRFAPLAKLAAALRPLAPPPLRKRIPLPSPAQPWPTARHARKMLIPNGCVQSVLAPSIDAAAARVLDRLGVSLIRVAETGCCGALDYHLSARERALAAMRRNIDAWTPWLDAGAEAIVMTASGCGLTVKEYGEILRHDPDYAEKAACVSARTFDPVEILAREDLDALRPSARHKIAAHAPCSLQHGQKLAGALEDLLSRLGCELTPTADAHLCCGSAGSYSLLQPELSKRLRDAKLQTLQAGEPECLVTANVGCLLHLRAAADRPVLHWIEWLDANRRPERGAGENPA